MIRLARITIYPIKSLDGIDVDSVEYKPSGALADDRRWALVDEEGRFVNAKRVAKIQRIRTSWHSAQGSFEMSIDGGPAEAFQEVLGASGPAAWLSDALGMRCKIIENSNEGFPDDTEAPGPTLLSTATLKEVGGWFDDFDLEEARRRFRANLEIDAPEPMWEDQLVSEVEFPGSFELGGGRWLATGICQRCVVPSRNSLTGEVEADFPKKFSRRRQEKLPSWSPRSRFDHFYRLAINTRLAKGESGGSLRVGDTLQLSDS